MDELNNQYRSDNTKAKKLYGDTLLYQKAVQDQLKNNYGKMTDHEKKLNKVDLQAYKHQEGQVYGTIPGLHHTMSVASVPTNKTMAPQMELNGPAAGKMSVDFNKVKESP